MSAEITKNDMEDYKRNPVVISREYTLRARLHVTMQGLLVVDANKATEVARLQASALELTYELGLTDQILQEAVTEEMKNDVDRPTTFRDPRDPSAGASVSAPSIG